MLIIREISVINIYTTSKIIQHDIERFTVTFQWPELASSYWLRVAVLMLLLVLQRVESKRSGGASSTAPTNKLGFSLDLNILEDSAAIEVMVEEERLVSW